MHTFPTIKALVFDYVHRTRGLVDYEELAKLALTHFPKSAWKPTHWAFYSYEIRKGMFKSEFSEEERANLGSVGQPSRPEPEKEREGTELPSRELGTPPKRHEPDPEIKRIGDTILNQVRFALSLAAPQDANLRFKLNRWVYSRLQLDERIPKRAIKQRLWDSSPLPRTCVCGRELETLRELELHRKDPDLPYTAENCQLLCRKCHQGLR